MLFAIALLGGCATTEPGVFQYNATTPGEARPTVWPAAESGEPPRYQWLGELTGENNFRTPDAVAEARSTFVKAFIWLVGLLEEAPLLMQRPQSGVIDETTSRIFVTDTNRLAVCVFDQAQGRFEIWDKAAGLTPFAAPAGIALGMGGEIFVADAKLAFVTRLNQKGESVGTIGKGSLQRPFGVAFDAAKRQLYVVDTGAHDIKVFDDRGQLLRTMGKRGDATGQFNFPTYITFKNGELVVADTMNARVQVLDAESGKAKHVFGTRGMNVGNMPSPKGVALDSEDNIYVVESAYDHLLVYNSGGELLLGFGGEGLEPGKFYLPAGVWIDAHDRVYVADMFNSRVAVFQFLGSGKPKQ